MMPRQHPWRTVVGGLHNPPHLYHSRRSLHDRCPGRPFSSPTHAQHSLRRPTSRRTPPQPKEGTGHVRTHGGGGGGADGHGGGGGAAAGLPAGLYVVGTPIGNMRDMTERAVSVLRAVDCIACEDTRTTAKLLHRHEIPAGGSRLLSYVESRGREARVFSRANAGRVLRIVKSGGTAALVSESGMPVVSDPGSVLVAQCHEIGVRVYTVPGPSAALAALSVSGFAGDRFLFQGFLPRKRSKRLHVLRELSAQDRTIVLFENPGRVRETLEDVCEVFGRGRRVAVCRELTKKFESTTVMPVGTFLQSGQMEHEDMTSGGEDTGAWKDDAEWRQRDEEKEESPREPITGIGEHVILIQGDR